MTAALTRTPKPYRRWLRFSLRSKLVWAWLLLGFGSVVLFGTMLYAPTARWWTRSSGEHLTLGMARRQVHLDLPDGAADIRFYQHLQPDEVVVVDFAITEDVFLEWAARQGWKPNPVVGSVRIWPRSAFGDWATVVTVTDGHGYHTLRRGEPDTFSVTYDRGTRRAFYSFRSRPLNGDD
jgi:hypothetical protein